MPDSPAPKVRRWRKAVGQPCADTPTLDADRSMDRRLVNEESRELLSAIDDVSLLMLTDDEHLARIAQEAADLVWVTYGLCELLGIDLDRALSEVGAANMRKVAGGVKRRADGKILKPDGWVGPDMHAVIEQTRALGRQT